MSTELTFQLGCLVNRLSELLQLNLLTCQYSSLPTSGPVVPVALLNTRNSRWMGTLVISGHFLGEIRLATVDLRDDW